MASNEEVLHDSDEILESQPASLSQPEEAESNTEDTTSDSTPDFYIFNPESEEVLPESEVSEDDEDFPEDYPDYSPTGFISPDQVMLQSKREDTRNRLAIVYVIATFIMFVLGFVVSILDAAWRQVSIIDNLSVVMPLLSGLFLGSLGFVIGYYFRKGEDGQ